MSRQTYPEVAIAGVRDTMDRVVGSCLAGRGKGRYCDKGLGTARFAPWHDATVIAVTKQAQDDSDWDMIGSLEVWEQVIDGQVNLSVALRACQLRYCGNGEASALAADTRIAIVGQLLGLEKWKWPSGETAQYRGSRSASRCSRSAVGRRNATRRR